MSNQFIFVNKRGYYQSLYRIAIDRYGQTSYGHCVITPQHMLPLAQNMVLPLFSPPPLLGTLLPLLTLQPSG